MVYRGPLAEGRVVRGWYIYIYFFSFLKAPCADGKEQEEEVGEERRKRKKKPKRRSERWTGDGSG